MQSSTRVGENMGSCACCSNQHKDYEVIHDNLPPLTIYELLDLLQVNDSLRLLPRELILQLRANPNISLGGGYRRYPGFSAAQVRKSLGVGW